MKVFSIEKFLNDPSILAEVKLYCLANGWPQACEGKSADKTPYYMHSDWMVEKETEKAYIPFSDADMVELTGRKVECNGKFFEVTDCRVMVKIGDDWFDAEEMFDMFTIGGKPCGMEV